MLLNALWIGIVQAGSVGGSVVVILALLAVLSLVFVRLVRLAHTDAVASWVTDVTVGLYLGWVSVATLANIAAFLSVAGVGELGLGATAWSVVVLVAAAGLSVAYAVFGRTRPDGDRSRGARAGVGPDVDRDRAHGRPAARPDGRHGRVRRRRRGAARPGGRRGGGSPPLTA